MADSDKEEKQEPKPESDNEDFEDDEPAYDAPKKKSGGGKYWDEALMDKFQDLMEDEILEICKDIDSYPEQQDDCVKAVNKILDISQENLEKFGKNFKMYKYFSNCMIFDKRTVYRKHMKFFWEKISDKMISVKVNTERLHILLLAYCIYYGAPEK